MPTSVQEWTNETDSPSETCGSQENIGGNGTQVSRRPLVQ
jgi:hypothetical protein